MCGRARCTLQPEHIAQSIGLPIHDCSAASEYTPRNSLHPGQNVPIVVGNSLLSMTWGLIPSYQKASERLDFFMMMNARSETVTSKNAFRRLVGRRRCVVVFEGFYEWQDRGKGGGRQPYYVHFADRRPMLMAGLYDEWIGNTRQDESEKSGPIKTFTVLTTAASPRLAWLHRRMPLLLGTGEARRWLATGGDKVEGESAAALLATLQPYNEDDLVWHPVTQRLNKIGYNESDCAEPIELKEIPKITSFFQQRGGAPAPAPAKRTLSEAGANAAAERVELKRERPERPAAASPPAPGAAAKQAAAAAAVAAATAGRDGAPSEGGEEGAKRPRTAGGGRTPAGGEEEAGEAADLREALRRSLLESSRGSGGEEVGRGGGGRGGSRREGRLEVVARDLVGCGARYLCHQANCETAHAKGLAKALFDRFPATDVYREATETRNPGLRVPGEILLRETEEGSGQFVVHLFGQRAPGKPRSEAVRGRRLAWFRAGLGQLALHLACNPGGTVAFPYNIGCGLAGGRWLEYRAALEEFAAGLPPSCRVVLCRFEPPPSGGGGGCGSSGSSGKKGPKGKGGGGGGAAGQSSPAQQRSTGSSSSYGGRKGVTRSVAPREGKGGQQCTLQSFFGSNSR